MRALIVFIVLILSFEVFGKEGKVMSLKLSSSAFKHNDFIPAKYTCDGEDISPEIRIEGVPSKAKSLVLICEDPDAPMGTWDHWILYNIPPTNTIIPEGIKPLKEFPNGMKHGLNSWGRVGYGGPCPPSGVHRYFFKVYALDILLELPHSATKSKVLKAMEGHIIAQSELMGKYSRKK
ncbi:MAG: YbhB/YbcL family Raf kinase inhibitor-like protein [Spirochaetia bacterium]|nr:YbhB/YbcL family Raf kinase inhibitor-like protein [Spirochaetota bacterium]MCX8096113.1 YbhB/YbcL family Raf kinase inhibitor-like protein [Spirochaetota bacterium]MDW8113071.1 YbhB/YbcL family Raf kinase inhibitor-like protein [Spirochaetia bacterium]